MKLFPRPTSRKFNLYDIILNVWQVSEALDSVGQIDGKLTRITSAFKVDGFDNDAFCFDFFRDNTFEQHSTEKVNTKFRIYNEMDKNQLNDYFACIPWYYHIYISWKYNKNWIQKKDHLMWLTNAILAFTSVLIAYYAIRLTQKASSPLKLDAVQMQKVINAIDNDEPISVDSVQFAELKTQLFELRKAIKKNSAKASH